MAAWAGGCSSIKGAARAKRNLHQPFLIAPWPVANIFMAVVTVPNCTQASSYVYRAPGRPGDSELHCEPGYRHSASVTWPLFDWVIGYE